MDRKIDTDKLVATAGIAPRMGVKCPQFPQDWCQRHDNFPEPVTQLEQALVCNWPDVERWAKTTECLQ